MRGEIILTVEQRRFLIGLLDSAFENGAIRGSAAVEIGIDLKRTFLKDLPALKDSEVAPRVMVKNGGAK